MITVLRVVAHAKSHSAYLLRLRGASPPEYFRACTAAKRDAPGIYQNPFSLRDTFVSYMQAGCPHSSAVAIGV